MTTPLDDNQVRSNLALLDPGASVSVDLDAARRGVARQLIPGPERRF